MVRPLRHDAQLAIPPDAPLEAVKSARLIIHSAALLMSSPSNWERSGLWATNAGGFEVMSSHRDAVAWSAVAAIFNRTEELGVVINKASVRICPRNMAIQALQAAVRSWCHEKDRDAYLSIDGFERDKDVTHADLVWVFSGALRLINRRIGEIEDGVRYGGVSSVSVKQAAE